ncbi:alpha/beta fold hydrolase [Leptobacterium flavescens]|uniref:Alpha/beta fold hydrolase n=1 Tax=Leptobacterium flavescens TaxID=472055 RepID=A0A6P0UTB8_9FLAO|nr:alpha/beta hydrolase [Leptobacterium flavescens]NER15248.1 alpha/beta fold hydrolase [Leptobacterium flavescens]
MKKLINRYLPVIVGKYLNLLSLVSPKKAVLKAFYIFCTPRKGNVLPHQSPFLEEAKDQVLSQEKFRIQTYRWNGKNKTILLVHGWESNSFRWRKLIKELKKEDYNIISIDAPAHGDSEGKHLNVPLYHLCLLEAIEVYKPEIIIGHSIGGMTTVYNQYRSPDPSVKKLVILGAPSELSRIMNDYQDILNLKPRIMKELESEFFERFGFDFKGFSVASFARQVKQKGLIIHDTTDTIAPVSESEAIHRNWENSTFIKTEKSDHSLQHQEVFDHIMDFLVHA